MVQYQIRKLLTERQEMYKKINTQKKEDVEEAGTPSGISMNAQIAIQVFYFNGKIEKE